MAASCPLGHLEDTEGRGLGGRGLGAAVGPGVQKGQEGGGW